MNGWGLWTMITAAVAATSSSILLYHKMSTVPKESGFTHLRDNHPTEWTLPPLARVHMSFEDTVHYAWNTVQGRAEWNTTLPSGGAMIYLGQDKRPFTLGILHQIRCIGIIREILDSIYNSKLLPDAQYKSPHLAKHCMNYLRQMVLCAADLRLETVRTDSGSHITVPDVTHTCWDWSEVYIAAENNYEDFKKHFTTSKEGT